MCVGSIPSLLSIDFMRQAQGIHSLRDIFVKRQARIIEVRPGSNDYKSVDIAYLGHQNHRNVDPDMNSKPDGGIQVTFCLKRSLSQARYAF